MRAPRSFNRNEKNLTEQNRNSIWATPWASACINTLDIRDFKVQRRDGNKNVA